MLRDQPRPVFPDLPRIWLFTDERNDAFLERAIRRLPRRSGIIFRHYHLPERLRRARFESVKKLARRRGHKLLLAGPPLLARRWGADGFHGRTERRSKMGGLIHSVPVHDGREIRQANLVGADIFFLSPILATRSHPGHHPMNPVQAERLAASCRGKVIYLGGMDQHRYRLRKNSHTHGWAAIDAFCQT